MKMQPIDHVGGKGCVWEEDEDDEWNTQCGESIGFDDGSPMTLGMLFCCYCGEPITYVVMGEEDEDEE